MQVAESLLRWLRSLPYPIVPCKLFRSFLRIRHCHSQSESLSQLHYLFQQACRLTVLYQIHSTSELYCIALFRVFSNMAKRCGLIAHQMQPLIPCFDHCLSSAGH